ncbi:MAG TPA: aldolase/citrate lyase family protein [Gemmatimonadales bacterium]|nr:aldolase/citrate lyase family protein [Gemmatimonadales bacterium]
MELRARRVAHVATVVAALGFHASVAPGQAPAQAQPTITRLLAAGQPVFGIFSGPHTPEQGAVMARSGDLDFVFYSLESGPFDIPGMQAYMDGMRRSMGDRPAHPVALRIPPIRDGSDVARERVRQALAAGVASIVFPHVEAARDAAVAVEAMGPELWPVNPNGRLVAMLIIEDTAGVARTREIVSTPGVSVVFAGPGDLRRAYNGDMAAVERAIQTVLAACNEFNVPCGITAGVDDIAARLAQGFRVIIVTQAEALAVGKRAAGR